MAKKSVILNVQERTETGTGASRRSRRKGLIPAVVYSQGGESKYFSISELEWISLSKKGDIHIVALNTSSGSSINALVKEIQHDYLKGVTIHIDFQEVRMDEEIETSVTVHSRGIPIGISQGGVLEQLLHEINVSCLPGDIPESIEVDVTGLELDKAILVKDLPMPEKVKVLNQPNSVVFHVIVLRVEAEPVPAEGAVVAEGAATGAEPELVGGKGSKEEDAEEEKEKGKEKEKKK